VFGLALDALEDKVKVSRIYPGVGRIAIKNSDQAIPSMVESNSAGLVVKKMMQDFEISDSTEIEITKGADWLWCWQQRCFSSCCCHGI
jgi:homoserine kinase